MVMGRPRSFDTDKALDEAMEVFWRHGYDGASLAMPTRAAGVRFRRSDLPHGLRG